MFTEINTHGLLVKMAAWVVAVVTSSQTPPKLQLSYRTTIIQNHLKSS